MLASTNQTSQASPKSRRRKRIKRNHSPDSKSDGSTKSSRTKRDSSPEGFDIFKDCGEELLPLQAAKSCNDDLFPNEAGFRPSINDLIQAPRKYWKWLLDPVGFGFPILIVAAMYCDVKIGPIVPKSAWALK